MKAKGGRRLAVAGCVGLALVLVVVELLSHGVFSHAWQTGPFAPESSEKSSSNEGRLNADEPTSSDEDAAEEAGAAAEVLGDLEDTGASFASSATTSERDLVAAARELLEEYQDEGDCLLRQAGYLDLLGKAWGCVVEGPGWVDLVVVREDSGGGSTQRVLRMRAGAWEEELASLGL